MKITVDSFGADCPTNWEEIASFLNEIIDDLEIADDRDAVNVVWEKYWNGEIPDAPIAKED